MPNRLDAQRASCWLRCSVAAVWFATGVLVVHPHYRKVGADYLAMSGLPEWLMYLACAIEVVLAVIIVRSAANGLLTLLQIVAICGFTTVLALADPMLLVHPFGMLTKNIPMLSCIAVAWSLHRSGWTARNLQVLRMGMAIIWITEGLFPKILFQQPMELEVVANSGLVPMDPGLFLVGMGAAQIVAGVAAMLLRGRVLSILLCLQLGALLVLPVLVAPDDASTWVHPFGPATKNIPIVAGTLVVLLKTSESSPPAKRLADSQRIAHE